MKTKLSLICAAMSCGLFVYWYLSDASQSRQDVLIENLANLDQGNLSQPATSLSKKEASNSNKNLALKQKTLRLPFNDGHQSDIDINGIDEQTKQWLEDRGYWLSLDESDYLNYSTTILESMAQENDYNAQIILGRRLLEQAADESSTTSIDQAISWFELAAAQGKTFAIHEISRAFKLRSTIGSHENPNATKEQLLAIEKDYLTALAWEQVSLDLGDPLSLPLSDVFGNTEVQGSAEVGAIADELLNKLQQLREKHHFTSIESTSIPQNGYCALVQC